MYSAIPEQEIRIANDRFAQKTYSVGDGTQIAVGATKRSFSAIKQLFTAKPSNIKYFYPNRPQRVTYNDITNRNK